jgi:uncharacterized protein YndB with AHSA1/START domain
MATDAPAQPRKRRLRKRYLIPALLLALLVVVFAWLYRRGTVAETAERDPRSPADAAVTQLVSRDGRTFVRCALVVDAPPADVWRVVTDYDHQAEFLPYVGQLSSERLGGGRVRVRGVAHSRLWGDWPFESVVTEEEHPDRGEYAVTWDEEDAGGLAVNRGGWALAPAGEGQTLLVYTLQIEMPNYPTFLIRNILMDRVASVLRAVRDEVARRGRG